MTHISAANYLKKTSFALGLALLQMLSSSMLLAENLNMVTISDEEFAAIAANFQRESEALKVKAEQGDANAMNLLGNRMGVSKEAVFWLRKASELGHAQAQENLAFFYMNGYSVPQSIKMAYVWYSVSVANGGHKSARLFRDELESKLSPIALEQAQEMALEYYEKYQPSRN